MAKKLPFFRLFQYATKLDYLFLVLGTTGAIGIGVLQPVLFYILGNIYQNMGPLSTAEDYYDQTVSMVYIILILGGGYIIICYAAVVSWVYIGSRQSYHFRVNHYKALLAQDPQWYDRQSLPLLSAELSMNAVKVERATGDKMVMIIMTVTLVVSSLIIDIIICLQLWLVSLAFLPFVGGGLMLTNIGIERTARLEDASYKSAASLTEEVLPEIKTVLSLTAEKSLTQRYASSLGSSFLASIRSGGLTGLGTGLAVSSFLGFMAASFVVAAQLVDNGDRNWTRGDEVSISSVIIVVFVSIMAFNSIGTLVPCLKMVVQGQLAAGEMMEVVGSRGEIESGEWKGEVRGRVELKGVTFAYPTKSDRDVLKGVSFEVEEKQRVAIVGESGSGKSTIVSLLLRLYDLPHGCILIDGRPLPSWHLPTLRDSIGLVSQEPLLFHGSLLDNIRLARSDLPLSAVQSAVEKAQIGSFVSRLKKGLDTDVGEKGSQLSGGEKQRVALARVLIRCPKILVLDEATSALDSTTEKALMDTIDESLGAVTTIMVAHRISTIRNARKIIVLNQGQVSEEGSYEELMQRQGQFYHYVRLQSRETTEPKGIDTVVDSAGKDAQCKDGDRQGVNTETPLLEGSENHGYTRRFLGMMGKEGRWVLLGTVGTLLLSSSYPISGMFLGLEVNTLSKKTGSELTSDTSYYAWFYGLCILFVLLGFLIESLSFPLAAAQLTRRFRLLAFSKLLTYDPGFFDLHSASALGQQLSSDCDKISALNGSVFAALLGLLLSLVCAAGISGVFAWEIMLVGLAMLPAFAFSVFATFIAQMQGLVPYDYEESSLLLSDSIVNHRTVQAFNLQPFFLSRYTSSISRSQERTRAKIHQTAIFFGLGFTLYLYCNALLFWFGAEMLVLARVTYDDMNVAMFAFLSGTDMISIVALFAPDVKAGQQAAKNVFEMLDYQPAVSQNEGGKQRPNEGNIEFQDVSFSYPSRPTPVLHHISFRIPSHSKLALVGQTGSGKSTVWQLLLRFYDPTEGRVMVDGVDTREYRLEELRRGVGVVGQEPVLFSGTVRYNVTLGLEREAGEKEVDDVIEEVQAGHFHSGSSSLDIEVGYRGSKLSGGQKQRVALARALLRSPKILIFDEATSALDSDTESAVIAGIGGRLASCTCLIIAHRMKTIMNVERIAVMHDGRLVETGSFQDLMDRKGFLFDLMGTQ